MQIMLNQDEIEEAIRNHVLSQLAIREDQEISIDLRAGRGENGFTATLDVWPRKGETSKPKPAFTKGDEAKQGPWLVQAETNVTKETAESQKEDKTGISTQKAEEPQPAASKAPKKGIFATVPKAAAEAAPVPTEETGTAAEEAEPGEPDQETPAEDDAREDAHEDAKADAKADAQAGAQDGNKAPAEQSAEQPAAKKSIFTFAPKKSAG